MRWTAIAVVLAWAPANARQCADMGGGYYQCDDGSFGNMQGEQLWLSEPDRAAPYGERKWVEHGCQRGEAGELLCD